jgi:hypothetical protein
MLIKRSLGEREVAGSPQPEGKHFLNTGRKRVAVAVPCKGRIDLVRYRFALNGNVYQLYATYSFDCFSSVPLFKCHILLQITSRLRPSI